MFTPLFLVTAAVCGLFCLGISAIIYACTVLTRPKSWLRSETLFGILLALLTGLFPAVLGGLVAFGFSAAHEVTTLGWFLSMALVLGTIVTLIGTVMMLRVLLKATRDEAATQGKVMPFQSSQATSTPQSTYMMS